MLWKFLKKLFSRRKSDSAEIINISDEYELPQSSGLYMKVSFATDRGRLRENNEDSFCIDGKYRHIYGRSESDCYIELDGTAHVYGLFDGMGGEDYGETASALAAAHFDRAMPIFKQTAADSLSDCMNEYADTADSAICDMLISRDSDRGGCTFAAVCVKDGEIYPFWLGDSRIYFSSSDGLKQISEDQTLAAAKVKAGVYSAEVGENSPDSHKLTAFLGRGGMRTESLYAPLPVESGVKILICSDGLSDMCSFEEIAAALDSDTARADSTDNTAQSLVNLALENGGADNVTCIVLEFDEFK
jgi:protein phosphatase